MPLVCPSCAALYDENPARLLPGGRPARCPHCHAAWHPEMPCDANGGSDNAPRKAIRITIAVAAGLPVPVHRAAGSKRTTSLDAFELSREQAHKALNAIRSRCREDRNRILHRRGARDAIPRPCADKSLAETKTLPLQARLPEACWDANTRMKISRALAEALAEAANETACSNKCADEQIDHERPRTCIEAASFSVGVDDEPTADSVNETEGGERTASAADKQYTVSVATLAARPANELGESAQLEKQPTPVDLEIEDLSAAPWGVNDPDFKAAPSKRCEDYEGTVTISQRSRPLTKPQKRKVAGLRARQEGERDVLLNRHIETRRRETLIQEARKAAQRAIREFGPEPRAAANGWRNMWIALVIIGTILLFLRDYLQLIETS